MVKPVGVVNPLMESIIELFVCAKNKRIKSPATTASGLLTDTAVPIPKLVFSPEVCHTGAGACANPIAVIIRKNEINTAESQYDE
ncbi:MAG: hypothetical protein BWX63_02110 [Bacteroidetes bacterium ADurb.Bin041]|nr:MAG: hypothetical protein BWX63_02110 [Bacteroidetes bacterium ADurb.Bin041]